ncbi:UNVERIFIED_CONTAM: hypothetical protein Slati_2516200 [Sesamum latifolium]|uniref:Reverse transcriptase/retrotransposon-derived protein RNase H-like domain-containing protein n=1 Tax=Sesamum latifolium TaxID=2727402 RepID=A0AAW2WFA9_9LAMI
MLGIEANPEENKAIQDMSPLTTKKEVQKLIVKQIPISRAERGLPFFKTLRKIEDFSWNEECQEAFDNLKEYLSKLPFFDETTAGRKIARITINIERSSKCHVGKGGRKNINPFTMCK